jgi:hypothetical protein
MLNTIIFINRIPVDDAEATIYHGSSYRYIRGAIDGDKWYFGCAANHEADGEGLEFPGEREALDKFFQLDPLVSVTDVLSSQQLHGALTGSHKDLYNSCWSISKDAALKFAHRYDDGVILSVKATALAASIECLARKWKQVSHEARIMNLQSLFSGDPDGIPETGWGAIQASAAFVGYLPKDYQHLSNQDDSRSSMFTSPILRNMRLPGSHNGIDLESEKELRYSLNLSNSDGCRMRNPAGLGNVLAPIITQANTTSGYHGIWLHGLRINEVEGFTMIQSEFF